MGFAKPRNRSKPKTDTNEKFVAEVNYLAKRLNRDPAWVFDRLSEGGLALVFECTFSTR